MKQNCGYKDACFVSQNLCAPSLRETAFCRHWFIWYKNCKCYEVKVVCYKVVLIDVFVSKEPN